MSTSIFLILEATRIELSIHPPRALLWHSAPSPIPLRSPASCIVVLQVKNYKDVKDLFILGDTSEVVTNLDDSLVTINTVLSSRYVGGIRGMVDEWRGKLVTLQVMRSTGRMPVRVLLCISFYNNANILFSL